MIGIQNQNFGVEIELTGISRPRAARIIAEFFGGNAGHRTDGYDSSTATDRKGRTWKCMRDSSIRPEKKVR